MRIMAQNPEGAQQGAKDILREEHTLARSHKFFSIVYYELLYLGAK